LYEGTDGSDYYELRYETFGSGSFKNVYLEIEYVAETEDEDGFYSTVIGMDIWI
jgi:hypothetical protein